MLAAFANGPAKKAHFVGTRPKAAKAGHDRPFSRMQGGSRSPLARVVTKKKSRNRPDLEFSAQATESNQYLVAAAIFESGGPKWSHAIRS
jgi:hypothetical protein